MALKVSLKRRARELAEIIRSFGADRGWSKEDLAISIVYEDGSDRFSITVGSDRKIDEKEWYLGILRAFRAAYPDEPFIAMHVGLVIENVQSLDEVYRGLTAGEDEIDLSDSY